MDVIEAPVIPLRSRHLTPARQRIRTAPRRTAPQRRQTPGSTHQISARIASAIRTLSAAAVNVGFMQVLVGMTLVPAMKRFL